MSDEQARLFAGLEIPATTRSVLARWVEQRLGATPGVRPVPPDKMHVTLCFLGCRPVAEVHAIAVACQILADEWRLELALGAVHWLPPRRPGVVAVGLQDSGRRLEALQSRLSRTLATGGWYVPERRPFLAHVTVARIAPAAARGRFRPFPLPAPVSTGFCATDLTLFRSRPGRAGSRYERLAVVRLAPPVSMGSSARRRQR